jgi:nucleotide-binding universal stress UspA family protein
MFNRILVPLDGSEVAARALEPAIKLAQHAHAEILLVRAPIPAYVVVPADSGYALLYPEQSLDHSEHLATEYLASIKDSLSRRGLRVRADIRRGEAAEAIVETAADEKADLIVMSSHGYSGVTRWLLGSVAEKVLRAARCPVLAVRSGSREPLRRMLIPLDGSALSEQALAPAMDVAAGLGLKVLLFRAVPTIDRSHVRRLEDVEPGFGYRVEEEMWDEAGAYLRELANVYRGQGLAIETAVNLEPAAVSILECAESQGVDLIAMATHGRSGLRRWVYGSVTEKVLRGASHSMLVVRPVA